MVRLLVPVLMAAAAWAQAPGDLFSKAPPEVDGALRARITKFYQAHVDGKFRQAEAYVAEDTKEFYYTANKPKYLGFEINKIDYTDSFTKAKATIVVQQIMMVPGFTDRPLKVPIPSYWKIDKGDWCWYVDPEALRRTPFGVRPADADKSAAATGSASLPAGIPQGPDAIKSIWSKIRVDKTNVELAPGGATEVRLHNGIPGPITVALDVGSPHGLMVKLPNEVKANESAAVSISARPDLPAGPGAVYTIPLRVQPTNQVIRIRVTITAAR